MPTSPSVKLEFRNKPMGRLCERLGINQRLFLHITLKQTDLLNTISKTAKQILQNSVQGNDASWDEHVQV